ncbi:MAG: sensor domain-containing diguanylate cyclase [Azonexus sp.]
MPDLLQPPRLLLLDLRLSKRAALPALAGLVVVNPNPCSGDCDQANTALAVLVAIDGEAAYADWQQRFHPMCPSGFPHVVLLDPWDPALARRIIQSDAADCCAMDDLERIELIVIRLEHQPRMACGETLPSASLAHLLRLQATVDTLPIPIYIKDRDRRYIACNKAFEDYLGLSVAEIVGKTVFDVASVEFAKLCDSLDIEHLAQGGTQTYESRVSFADSSIHDVVFHKAVFLDSAGMPDGIVGAMLDISERKALERRLEVLAATDFLTGAYNLRTFYDLGRHEMSRLARNGGELALVVIDLDHFKEINDRLGHAAGDEALRQFVAVVTENLRELDIFARAGGDEFRLLLPDTSLAGAHLVADRIRNAVNQITVRSPRGEVRLSISCGIARCDPGDESLDQATMMADDALYQAKAAGRNCIRPLLEQGWFPVFSAQNDEHAEKHPLIQQG